MSDLLAWGKLIIRSIMGQTSESCISLQYLGHKCCVKIETQGTTRSAKDRHTCREWYTTKNGISQTIFGLASRPSETPGLVIAWH